MKIAAFTQTYGEERIMELKLMKYDIMGRSIRNMCDTIIFSFHNCPKEFVEEAEELVKDVYPNAVFFYWPEMTYLESIRKSLDKLGEMGMDAWLHISDDEYGLNTIENLSTIQNIDHIIKTYKMSPDMYWLHIYGDESLPEKNRVPIKEKEEEGIKYYCYNSTEFQKTKVYSWNYGTYIANIDFLKNIFSGPLPTDAWNIELTLKRIMDNNGFERWGTNLVIFKSSNLHGINLTEGMSMKENLARFFPLNRLQHIY